MSEKIIILDFGSQYTQLIARCVREANVFCEIIPYHKPVQFDGSIKGVILSGSPFSVNQENAPFVDVHQLNEQVPVLGVCYGAQLTAKQFGGIVEKSNKREYGRASLKIEHGEDDLLKGIASLSQVWMSHGDSILSLPNEFDLLATTESIPIAAFRKKDSTFPLHAVQFHPEVYHSTEGKKMIYNFLVNICGCKQDWTPGAFVHETVEALKRRLAMVM